jgi:hypothetical protein
MKVSTKRITSYDFFRGILLVGMITAHVFYNFFETTLELQFLFQWIPAGFLFFTGVVSGEILLSKKDNLYFFRRGVQIMGIFILCNVIKLFLMKGAFSLLFLGILIGDQQNLSFEILIPIAILFFCIPFLRFISVPAIGFFLLGATLFLFDLLARSEIFYSYNLHFSLLGIFGFFVGRTISLDAIREKFSAAFHVFPFVNLLFLLLLFLIFFTADAIFLGYSLFWSVQTFFVILLYFSLPNIFRTVKHTKTFEKIDIRKFFEPLGIHSLFLYVFHIAFLGSLHILMPNLVFIEWWQALLFALNVTIFSFAIVKFLEQIFRSLPRLQAFFRFIF